MNPEIEAKLRPWQIAPANHLLQILQKYDSAIDTSETGCGKTFVAVAIAQALQLPTLVIAPKIAITQWLAVAEHFNEPISVINYERLRTGGTVFSSRAGNAQVRARGPTVYVCRFCSRRFTKADSQLFCPSEPHGLFCVAHKPRSVSHNLFEFHQAVKFVIFDEVQRCSGMNSLNSKMLIACKRQKIKHLMLSATPFDTVLKARAICFSLDLFSL